MIKASDSSTLLAKTSEELEWSVFPSPVYKIRDLLAHLGCVAFSVFAGFWFGFQMGVFLPFICAGFGLWMLREASNDWEVIVGSRQWPIALTGKKARRKLSWMKKSAPSLDSGRLNTSNSPYRTEAGEHGSRGRQISSVYMPRGAESEGCKVDIRLVVDGECVESVQTSFCLNGNSILDNAVRQLESWLTHNATPKGTIEGVFKVHRGEREQDFEEHLTAEEDRFGRRVWSYATFWDIEIFGKRNNFNLKRVPVQMTYPIQLTHLYTSLSYAIILEVGDVIREQNAKEQLYFFALSLNFTRWEKVENTIAGIIDLKQCPNGEGRGSIKGERFLRLLESSTGKKPIETLPLGTDKTRMLQSGGC